MANYLNDRAFQKAISYIIQHEESGYISNLNEKGGETKYGISKRAYPAVDIKNLSLEDAKKIHYIDHWLKNKCHFMPTYELALKLLSLSINVGSLKAGRLVQRALRGFGRMLIEDGVINAQTLDVINNVDPHMLLMALKSEAAGYYRLLAEIQPTKKRLISGWLNRAYN